MHVVSNSCIFIQCIIHFWLNIHCALGPASLPAFCHVLLLMLFARVVFHALPCYRYSVICVFTELWTPVTYYYAVSSCFSCSPWHDLRFSVGFTSGVVGKCFYIKLSSLISDCSSDSGLNKKTVINNNFNNSVYNITSQNISVFAE